ncbi:hypothetical protein BK723_16550 [Bacillus thuringiensis serovar pondicheriensis]|nr:hypothetical protein BK723_16550 [Bacillus thuringiensis serovar pondicheriensis]
MQSVHSFLYENVTDAENMCRSFKNVNEMFKKMYEISLTHMNRRSYNKSIRYMNSCSYVQIKR